MADLIDDLDKPNKTLPELQEWLFYDEDIRVTLRQLQRAVESGELVPTMLSNRRYFSKRSALNFLAGREGKRRAPRTTAAQH